jgi:hypothetical protein
VQKKKRLAKRRKEQSLSDPQAIPSRLNLEGLIRTEDGKEKM